MVQVDLAPRCDAEPVVGMRCWKGAQWTVLIHSPVTPHEPDDTVWRVLCRDHALQLIRWVQKMTDDHDTVWCPDCAVMLQPAEWLIENQDMDMVGWIEWKAKREMERNA